MTTNVLDRIPRLVLVWCGAGLADVGLCGVGFKWDGLYHPREGPVEPHLDASSAFSPEKKIERVKSDGASSMTVSRNGTPATAVRCPTGEGATMLLVTKSYSSCSRGASLPCRSTTEASLYFRSIT